MYRFGVQSYGSLSKNAKLSARRQLFGVAFQQSSNTGRQVKEDDVSQHLLVVIVCDNDDLLGDDKCIQLLTDKRKGVTKKVIVIGHENNHKNHVPSLLNDNITYGQLSKTLQDLLLSLTLSFQGKHQTVKDLIGNALPDQVIGCQSIEELVFAATDGQGKIREENINFPPGNPSSILLEHPLYIKRKLRSTLPFDQQFRSKLAQKLKYESINTLDEKYRVDPHGRIQWLVKGEDRKEIWEKMASLLDPMITESPIFPSDGSALITEEDSILNELDSRNNQARQIVTIITGVAGTGKSTILYHYYDKTKEIHADHWVIKINFKDMAPAFLLQLSKSSRHSLFFGRSDAIDFLVDNLPFVIGSSSFARSLLRHRLETGDRIVLMLDGFDEIDSQCQDFAIQLMKVLIEDGKQQQANSVRLFVTTRSHIVNDLQFQLSQLAYALENFNKKDQVHCLTSYWMKHNSKTKRVPL